MDSLIADIKAETKFHTIMEYINARLYATGSVGMIYSILNRTYVILQICFLNS